jgi:putative glutamine amidotransferase
MPQGWRAWDAWSSLELATAHPYAPAMNNRPLIGLTMDAEDAGGYSRFPWYALRRNYCGSVVNAGGTPLALANETALVEQYLDTIDGLIVTGGAFDVDPALFGATEQHEKVDLKPGRTDFELALTRGALARDMPVLGICGGQQLLHVILGGKLIQHIPDVIENALEHEQPNPRDEAGHRIEIKPGTLLHDIVGSDKMHVNSAHHQAALDEPDGVVINAYAEDGVIEGMEAPAHRFCLGVQWHPEFEIDQGDAKILKSFVEVCHGG